MQLLPFESGCYSCSISFRIFLQVHYRIFMSEHTSTRNLFENWSVSESMWFRLQEVYYHLVNQRQNHYMSEGDSGLIMHYGKSNCYCDMSWWSPAYLDNRLYSIISKLWDGLNWILEAYLPGTMFKSFSLRLKFIFSQMQTLKRTFAIWANNFKQK